MICRQKKSFFIALLAVTVALVTANAALSQPTCEDVCTCDCTCWYLCYAPWDPSITITCGLYGVCQGGLDCSGDLNFTGTLDLGQMPIMQLLQDNVILSNMADFPSSESDPATGLNTEAEMSEDRFESKSGQHLGILSTLPENKEPVISRSVGTSEL